MQNYYIKQILDSLKKQDNYRYLRDFSHNGAYLCGDKKRLLNLASNDYLGLATSKKMIKKFYRFFRKTSQNDFSYFSSSSSRLLSGGFGIYGVFEAYLDSIFLPKKSLLFNSGYHLNISLLQALSHLPNSLFLLDFYAHASIIDGVRLGGADFKRFRHNDMLHLRELLESRAKKYEHIFIISEGVFSMEGDFAMLGEIIALKNEYKKMGKNIYIYLDEAHSVGVFGKCTCDEIAKQKRIARCKKQDLSDFAFNDFVRDFGAQNDGLGLARALDLHSQIDFLIFTFGKAIGSMGACVICDKHFKDFFVNKARGLIYSTALPPINVAFSHFVFQKLGTKSMARRRGKLANLSEVFKSGLGIIASKYHLTSLGKSHIFSLILGENTRAIKLAKKLESSGIYAPAIKYPTVPKDMARIRFCLNANISQKEAQNVLENLEKHIKSI
ncbi:aminotransferase class I/II-fold pyridoxal phosphate-dependent enzyme [Helicobacter sp. T3_23-1056]